MFGDAQRDFCQKLGTLNKCLHLEAQKTMFLVDATRYLEDITQPSEHILPEAQKTVSEAQKATSKAWKLANDVRILEN